MRRGISTVADIRARSKIDPITGCWHWQGAMSGEMPRIFTWDYAREEKRCMTGSLAVFNISRQAPPIPGWSTFRRCVVHDCVCPVHIDQARDRAAIGEHIRLNGARKGNSVEQRRASAAKGREAQGIVPIPQATVLAVRAAGPDVLNTELAVMYGISKSSVGYIRSGRRKGRYSAESISVQA